MFDHQKHADADRDEDALIDAQEDGQQERQKEQKDVAVSPHFRHENDVFQLDQTSRGDHNNCGHDDFGQVIKQRAREEYRQQDYD